MTRNERKLKAVEKTMAEKSAEIQGIWKKAEDEDRESTQEELQDVNERLKAIEQLKVEKKDAEDAIRVEAEVKAAGKEMGSVESVVSPRVGDEPLDRMIKSIGEQFVESKGYQRIKDPDQRGQSFTSGAVEMDFGTKGTLLEGPGGGGAALGNLVPGVIPGVVDKLFQRLTVADLLLSGQTNTPQLIYAVEGTATSGAAGVAEAGAKPESTLGLTSTTESVKKIATILNISDEMLEDAAQVQSYINGRLSLFIRIEEERQLLRGAGTNELQGIMNGRGINIYAGGTAVGNRAVQLFKALNGQRGSSLLEPDWIVINPTDWETIRLLTDTAGQYFGGGPFQGPYGNGRNFEASNIVSGADEFIWNKPVIVTGALGAGTALIGTRLGAQVFRKSGISVEATNSHGTNFASDLVTIRAEERLGLAVYRPSAFTDVRLS